MAGAGIGYLPDAVAVGESLPPGQLGSGAILSRQRCRTQGQFGIRRVDSLSSPNNRPPVNFSRFSSPLPNGERQRIPIPLSVAKARFCLVNMGPFPDRMPMPASGCVGQKEKKKTPGHHPFSRPTTSQGALRWAAGFIRRIVLDSRSARSAPPPRKPGVSRFTTVHRDRLHIDPLTERGFIGRAEDRSVRRTERPPTPRSNRATTTGSDGT